MQLLKLLKLSRNISQCRGNQFQEDESAWKGKEDGVVNAQPTRIMDERNGMGAATGYIGR